MSIRNMSPQLMFEKLALEHKPLHAFNGKTKKDFDEWKKILLPKVMATLADFPERVPLNPQLLAEWEHDGLLKQRWIIDVQKYLSSTFLVNVPKGLKPGEKRPAILCWHGHLSTGKDCIMGDPTKQEYPDHDYGHKMAKEGFVTFAIDWMGKGDHNDNAKPNHKSQNYNRDWCNLYYLHATMLGMTSISIHVSHGMAATDFACSLPFVDSERLGVMGCSGGGTMTLWSAICDERFKASEIICYSDLWAYFGYRDINYCGMQVAPGLFKIADLPDVQGLIAPRPLLVDIGTYDICFLVDTAMMCYRKAEEIYRAAGAQDRLVLNLFPGGHGWDGGKSVEFFRKYLL